MLILFDFNGTLVDDDKPCWTAIETIFHYYGKTPPTVAEYYGRMETHWSDVFHWKGIRASQEEVNAIYVSALAKIYHNVQPQHGIIEVLSELRKRGYQLGIVSAGSKHINRPVLESAGLAHYFHKEFVEFENYDKAEAIERFVRVSGFQKDKVWYVGDAPSDIHASHKAGVNAVGFIPGFVPEHLVRAKEPKHTIRTLNELLIHV